MKVKIAILALFLPVLLPAQVVINEVCAANYNDWVIGGENEDWIELYNTGTAVFDVSGYWLSDRIDNPTKWQIPAGTTIPAGGRRVILLSGTGDYDPGYLGQLNTNFKVTQTAGEQIVFSNPGGIILESYDFSVTGPNQANHSFGRQPDGANNWLILTDPTPNAANGGPSGTTYAARPIFSQPAGHYGGAISLALSTTLPGGVIHYTLDGTAPSATSPVYSSPINLSTTTVVRAVVYATDGSALPGFIETNTYFFGTDQHSLMVFSCSGDDIDGQWWGDEAMHIEMFSPSGVFLSEASGDSNEHGNDSNAYGQRGFDYITRDAMGYDNELEYPVFHHSDRPSYERLIFKAAANDNYSFEDGGAHIRDAYVHELSILGDLHLDERTTESCIVYLNGNYWGVYEAREKVDDIDYTDYYYDQPEGMVDFIKTWGGTWADYGSITDWDALVGFITTNDMSLPANYEYVLSQYNTMSLIDYFILNGYVVATDWLNWNTAWWRGRNPAGDARRWRYALWDMDATFGHYINYTGVPSDDPNADPCQIEDMGDVGGQGHVPVLNALFDNESFLADYVQRYAGLSNSIFSCEQMIAVLDSMVNKIEPEMQRQCSRWGGTVAGWQNNVQEMRDFINARCNDEIIGGVEDCYDVTAYNVTVQIEGIGELEIEEIDLSDASAPWTGIFFGDLAIDLDAAGDECGTFGGWEIVSGTGTIADPSNPQTTMTITSDVTLVAHFIESDGFVDVVVGTTMPGAGVIEVNGTPQGDGFQTYTFPQGSIQTVSVAANEWFVFDEWNGGAIDVEPNDAALEVTFTACTTDTLEAIFIELPHARLTVDIQPSTAGTITMNGNVLDLEWTDVLPGEVSYSFETIPADIWSEFSHWEINHNVITPDELSTSIDLFLTEDDTLVAVYNIIPHHDLTVIVVPPHAATVRFAEIYSTETEQTGTFEAGLPIEMRVFPEPFYDFKGWKTAEGSAINPSPLSRLIGLTLLQNDTIYAYLEQQPYAYYVPNSFTPNNDGINDVFMPVGNAIDASDYRLSVYNRWGEKVFESIDPKIGWTGDMSGGEFYVKDEIYHYRLRIKSVFENEPQELTGSVVVFR